MSPHKTANAPLINGHLMCTPLEHVILFTFFCTPQVKIAPHKSKFAQVHVRQYVRPYVTLFMPLDFSLTPCIHICDPYHIGHGHKEYCALHPKNRIANFQYMVCMFRYNIVTTWVNKDTTLLQLYSAGNKVWHHY